MVVQSRAWRWLRASSTMLFGRFGGPSWCQLRGCYYYCQYYWNSSISSYVNQWLHLLQAKVRRTDNRFHFQNFVFYLFFKFFFVFFSYFRKFSIFENLFFKFFFVFFSYFRKFYIFENLFFSNFFLNFVFPSFLNFFLVLFFLKMKFWRFGISCVPDTRRRFASTQKWWSPLVWILVKRLVVSISGKFHAIVLLSIVNWERVHSVRFTVAKHSFLKKAGLLLLLKHWSLEAPPKKNLTSWARWKSWNDSSIKIL